MNLISPFKPHIMPQSAKLLCASKTALVAAAVGLAFMPTAEALVLDTGTVAIAPTGTLNLENNNLIVRSGSAGVPTGGIYSGLQGKVQTGLYGGPNGFWDGPGINSSVAAADPNAAHAVGVIDNAIVGYASWPPLEPKPLTGPEILIKYTYFGDADLDGKITLQDFSLIGDTSLGPVSWLSGDFDYDGKISLQDYSLIGSGKAAFDNGGGPLVAQGTLGAVPEPAGFALISCGLMTLLGRRRRH